MRRQLGSLHIRHNLALKRLTRRAKLSGSTLNDCRARSFGSVDRCTLVQLTGFCNIATSCLLKLSRVGGRPGTSLTSLHLDSRVVSLLGDKEVSGALLYRLTTRPSFPQLVTSLRVCIGKATLGRTRNTGTVISAVDTAIVGGRGPNVDSARLERLVATRVSRSRFYHCIVRQSVGKVTLTLQRARGSSFFDIPRSGPLGRVLRATNRVIDRSDSARRTCLTFVYGQLGLGFEGLSMRRQG